jgi:hypothetical protein
MGWATAALLPATVDRVFLAVNLPLPDLASPPVPIA